VEREGGLHQRELQHAGVLGVDTAPISGVLRCLFLYAEIFLKERLQSALARLHI
jgi:hypothetical protein